MRQNAPLTIIIRDPAMPIPLPEKIRKLRKDRQWSQADLGTKVGVHMGHISRLEAGKYQPSIDLLRKLARTFEVTADYLLDDEQGDMTPVTVADRSLAERVRLIAALDPEERDALLKIIDALLTKKKVVDLVTGQMAALPTG